MDAKNIAEQLGIVLNDETIDENSRITSETNSDWDSLAHINFLTRLGTAFQVKDELLTQIADIYDLQEIIRVLLKT